MTKHADDSDHDSRRPIDEVALDSSEHEPDSTESEFDDDVALDHDRRAFLGGMAAAGGLAAFGQLAAAGDGDDHGHEHAHDHVMALVPTDEATHTATRSGDWSQAGTWDKGVPGDGARVHVPEGITVTVDGEFDVTHHWLRVDGTLRFATDTDTHLKVDTIVTTEGSRFEIGTEDDPIADDVTAQITFADRGEIDESWDSQRVSRGLLTMGTVRTKGQEVVPFTELAEFAEAGDSSIRLSEAPDGWEQGDEIVVPSITTDSDQDEERTIASVSGATVDLEEPLEHDHVPPRDDLPTYVAHLDRNIRLESETAETERRGHVMFMDQDVELCNVGLYKLGRTDKSIPISNPMFGEQVFEETYGEQGTYGKDLPGKEIKDSEYSLEEYLEDPGPNPAARYSCHFHITGPDEHEFPAVVDTDKKPGVVENCVAWDNPGWAFVNHYSYAHFRDNVSYDVFGSHYNCEAGTEMGSFENNIAIKAEGDGGRRTTDKRKDIGDWGHTGNGFWIQTAGAEIEGNVVCGVNGEAYSWWGHPLPHSDEKDWSGLSDDDSRGRDLREGYESYPVVEANPNIAIPNVNQEFVQAKSVRPPKFKDNVAIGAHVAFAAWREQWDIYGNVPYPECFHADGLVAYNLGGYFADHDYTNNLRYSDCYVVNAGNFGKSGRTGIREIHENCKYVGISGKAFQTSGSFYDCELEGEQADIALRKDKETVYVQNTQFDTVQYGLYSADKEYVQIEDPTDPDELADVDQVFHRKNLLRVGAGFEDGEQSGPLTVKSHEDASGGEYVVHGDTDYEAFGQAIPDKQPSMLDGTDREQVNATTTVSDVPEGTYDVWLRHAAFIVDADRPGITRNQPTVDYRLDGGDWQTGRTKDFGTFGWGKLAEDVSLSGDVDVTVANDQGLRALDAVLLVGSGPDPHGPLTLETSRAGDHQEDEPGEFEDHTGKDEVTVTVAPNGNHSFDPAKIEIDQGTTVTWQWDADGHTVTATDQPAAADWNGNTAVSDAGHEHVHTFGVPGEYAYQCDLHAGHMTGAIRVNETDQDCQSVTEAIAGEDGTVNDAEMLEAIDHWQNDTEVPGTCGETVSDTDLLDLINAWRTGDPI